MPQLNREQLSAVQLVDRPLLVLAGAGSGKTRVITEKIAYLIEQRQINPRQVVAITFTNKAAREMLARIRARLPRDLTRGIRISTFHTFGLNLLRAEAAAAGLRPGFSILDPADCRQLLRELGDTEAHGWDSDSLMHQISQWKNELLAPAQALHAAATPAGAWAAAAYRDYQQALTAYNAVDFDDLIRRPVDLLSQDQPLRERWQQRIRHLLVDEYQDTNGAQYRLVQLLTGVDGGLTVVGDDDQSIYAWRGARPENLGLLQRDFPRLQVIKLEQNYRSTQSILKAANHLIGHNPHLFTKQLWSRLGDGEAIQVLPCSDAETEAARVVSELLRLRFRHRSRWADFALLYRGNHQSRLFEKLLREQGIPYRISGGQAFFERSEIRDLTAYLRLLVNPDDNPAFLRVVNVPRREIGPQALEKLAGFAQLRGCSLARAAASLGLAEHLEGRAQFRLQRFSEWLEQLRALSSSHTPDGLLRRLISELDYEAWLHDTSSSPRAATRRMDAVLEFTDWLQRLAEPATPGAPRRELAELVSRISLMDILDRQQADEPADEVQLLTLHTAKGLEFQHVFLVGFEEDLLPHRVSLEQGSIEEERRLAYVGLTRAQQTLTLSYAQRRRRQGEFIDCLPSRFLDELPPELLHWPDATPPDANTRQLSARAHLAGLKALLRNQS